MKAIDCELKGNVARIYLGEDDLPCWWGDDWDDAPYEHNASRVYKEYVAGHIDVAFPFDAVLVEACDGHENSPWCKADMRDGKIPMFAVMMAPPDYNCWDIEYDMAHNLFPVLDARLWESCRGLAGDLSGRGSEWHGDDGDAERFDRMAPFLEHGLWPCFMGMEVDIDNPGKWLPEGAAVMGKSPRGGLGN